MVERQAAWMLEVTGSIPSRVKTQTLKMILYIMAAFLGAHDCEDSITTVSQGYLYLTQEIVLYN